MNKRYRRLYFPVLIIFIIPFLLQSCIRYPIFKFQVEREIVLDGTITDVEIAAEGNIFITRYTDGTDGAIYVEEFGSSNDPLNSFKVASAVRIRSTDLKLDTVGNIIIAGWFSGRLSYFIGEELKVVTTPSDRSVFLTKIDSDGNIIWFKTWHQHNSVIGADYSVYNDINICLDPDNNIYVCGNYNDTIILENETDTFQVTSRDEICNMFLARFNVDGEIDWLQSYYASIGDLIVHEGYLYFGGGNAGYNTEETDRQHILFGDRKNYAFLCKADLDGQIIWGEAWSGATGSAGVESLTINPVGDVILSGNFSGTVDFDPDEGVTEHTGFWDSYISRFTPDGEFRDTIVWDGGMLHGDYSYNSIVFDDRGNLFFSGNFTGDIDLDPGDDEYFISAEDMTDSSGFLCVIDDYGNFLWGEKIIWCTDMEIGLDDSIYLTGFFNLDDETGEYVSMLKIVQTK